MKVIDCASKPTHPKSGIGGLVSRASSSVSSLLPVQSDAKTMEIIVGQFRKFFSNKYYLLRNVTLEGLENPIPLVLVGPTGIYVMVATAVKGVFRAKNESWAEMKGKTQQFTPVKPNLIQRTLHLTQSLQKFLTDKQVQGLEMHGVLIFTSPGTHVDAVRPAVRIVLMDGLEPFTTALMQGPVVMDQVDVDAIVNILHPPEAGPIEAVNRRKDSFDFIEEAKPPKPIAPPKAITASQEVLTDRVVTLSKKFRLTTGQWIFLGVMVVLEIVLLMGIIIVIMTTS